MIQIPENHWLKKLKSQLQAIDPSIELILYGSRARGTAHKDSDWDLLLLTEKEKLSLKEEKALRMSVYLQELEVGEPFGLQIFSFKDWQGKMSSSPFCRNVNKEGIRI